MDPVRAAGVTGTALVGSLPTPHAAPAEIAPRSPVNIPTAPASGSAGREETLARLAEALRQSGVKELELKSAYLRIEPNLEAALPDISVVDARTDQVIRRIPPDTLSALLHPNIFPRGVLLRLVSR